MSPFVGKQRKNTQGFSFRCRISIEICCCRAIDEDRCVANANVHRHGWKCVILR